MPPELGDTVRISAWRQAVSLSNDGEQTLYHLVIKADAATLGTVVVTDEQLESLTRQA